MRVLVWVSKNTSNCHKAKERSPLLIAEIEYQVKFYFVRHQRKVENGKCLSKKEGNLTCNYIKKEFPSARIEFRGTIPFTCRLINRKFILIVHERTSHRGVAMTIANFRTLFWVLVLRRSAKLVL